MAKKVVYKPLSQMIQWATVSKDGVTTNGSPVDITEDAIKAVTLFLNDQEDREHSYFFNNKTKVTISLTKLEVVGG